MGRSMIPWVVAAALVLGGAVMISGGLMPSVFASALKTPTALAAEALKPQAASPDTTGATPTDAVADRQGVLARKEAELSTREEHLREREVQIALKVLELDKMRSGEEAVRRVADLYSAMPPHRAAPALQVMEMDLVVQILRLVDPDQAAALLAYMDPARASEITTRLMSSTGGGS